MSEFFLQDGFLSPAIVLVYLGIPTSKEEHLGLRK